MTTATAITIISSIVIIMINTSEGATADQWLYQSQSGAMRGVMVSMSAFLACHQYYCTGSSLAWGLNLWAVVCGIF